MAKKTENTPAPKERPDGEEDNIYGWRFHLGPLVIALVLTLVFYIAVFVLAGVGN